MPRIPLCLSCLLLALGMFQLISCSSLPQQQPGASDVFNVRDFGAVGDGKTLDSPAINKAIDACAAAGGGTVYLPAGTYLSGSIHMKSYINLDIGAGAEILGAPQAMHAYDPAEAFIGTAYQDGGHTYFHNSLIWGENLKYVSVTGLGKINGGGMITGDKKNPDPSYGIGNKSIVFKLCSNVVIRDVTIAHGGHFAILVTGCNLLTIDNVIIDTDRDGMDIDCCTNTTVSNCRINSPGDDGLCPKSTYALGRLMPTENLTITNCEVSGFQEGTLLDGRMIPSKGGGTGRIKLGTESNGGFRNITISNCTFRDCRGLALEEVDGGTMDNITITNITMIDVAHYGIYITLGKRNRGPNITSNGIAKNIFISNVISTSVGPMAGIEITGMPGDDIQNLRLDNIRIISKGGGTAAQSVADFKELGTGYPEPGKPTPSYGVFARHVQNLELANVSVSYESTDMRPPMICDDVDGLQIDNFKAQVAEGIAPARFKDVSNVTIINSPVLDRLIPPLTDTPPRVWLPQYPIIQGASTTPH
jgi:polygalacturonase